MGCDHHRAMNALRLMILAGLLMLGGCSYIYDIVAVMIDGRLAFVVDQNSQSKPSCLTRVEVREVRARGDSDLSVWEAGQPGACENPFPIFYGQPILGEAVSPNQALPTVSAKPLQIGVIYEVSASSSEGSGYAVTRFRLIESGRVENLGMPN